MIMKFRIFLFLSLLCGVPTSLSLAKRSSTDEKSLYNIVPIFSPINSSAKNKELEEAISKIAQAEELIKLKGYLNAALLLDNVLDNVAKERDDYRAIATLNIRIAICYQRLNHHLGALFYLEDALKIIMERRDKVPEVNSLILAQLHETMGANYTYIGCYRLAQKHLKLAHAFFQKSKIKHKKEAMKRVVLLSSHISELLKEKKRSTASTDHQELSASQVVFSMDYRPDHFSWVKVITTFIFAVLFLGGGIFFFLDTDISSATAGREIKGGVICMLVCMIFFWEGLHMIVRAPLPILGTREYIALPFYLKEEEKGLLGSFFSLPEFSKRGTYYAINYEDIIHHKLEEITRKEEVGNYSHIVTYLGLKIYCNILQEEEIYVIYSRDCDPYEFDFFSFLISCHQTEKKERTEGKAKSSRLLGGV